MKISEGQTW